MTEDLVRLTDDHRYIHRDGHEVISVSKVLRQANIRPAPYMGRTKFGVDVMARALKRGEQVHRLTRAIDETGDELDALDDRFDPADFSEENINYVAGYRKFLAGSGYEAIAWEKVLYSATFDYAGRTDMVGWMPDPKRGILRVLGDRKTDRQLHRAVWLQLSAYRQAWNELYPDQPIDQTGAVKLNSDTTYAWVPNPLEPGDFPFFLGALWVARWHELQI